MRIRGRLCLAAKRFLLAREIASDFEDHFVRATQALRVGDPCDRSNQLGPMARGDLREELHLQVQESIRQGASVLSRGGPSGGRGFYYLPTVLGCVRQGMPVFDAETFGPVAALTSVTGAEDAVTLASSSPYGLSANVWTKDVALARRMALELEVGGVFINGVAASNPRVPIAAYATRLGFSPNCLDRPLRKAGLCMSSWTGSRASQLSWTPRCAKDYKRFGWSRVYENPCGSLRERGLPAP